MNVDPNRGDERWPEGQPGNAMPIIFVFEQGLVVPRVRAPHFRESGRTRRREGRGARENS